MKDNSNYKYWLNNAPDEIKEKIKGFSEKEIKENFEKDLSFGTAGIRNKMGIGTNKINEFTISKFILSYGKVLINKYKSNDFKKGVVIFHDNRKNSSKFSKIIAQIFSGLNIPAYLTKDNKLNSTPFLSYTIMNNDFIGGINVTASHNPKQYNGIKIYDESGKQIDEKIKNEIINNIDENIFEIKKTNENIFELDENIKINYINDIVNKISLVEEKDRNDLKIVYGTNHGTALEIGEKILKKTKVKYYIVKEQSFPDENFINTPFPNPQDERSFDLSKEYGDKYNCDALFLTDPDADRFGVMIKHENKWVYLNGNQIPVIQIYYKIKKFEEKNNKYNFKNKFVVRSFVTSKLADKIVKEKEIKLYESITGFGPIFEKVEEVLNNNKDWKLFFAWEESNGSISEMINRDKDSFQSLYQIIEIIYEYKLKNKTLIDLMNEIYDKYGYYLNDQITKNFNSFNGIEQMNTFIENTRKNKKIGDKIFGKEIIKIIDLKNDKTKFKKQNVIFNYFDNESWICLRPSGTEPILRIYIELVGEKKVVNNLLEKIKKEINENWK